MSTIRYMAHHHVAANILMVVLVVGGLLAVRSITVEVFPDVELDMVSVSVAYPGAGPSEVEEGICQPIEEAVHGLEGVKRVYAGAVEGGGSVTVELQDGADPDLLLQDVKSAVDRIITFPQQAERPVIQKLVRRRSVLSLVVYGQLDRHTLRQRAEALRDALLALPNITQADLTGLPPYEISIEVPEAQLRRHGLTLERIAAAVRAASVDLPAGAVKARGGEVLLRTKERRYLARQYRDVVVAGGPDGTLLTLGQLADVRETFQETDERALFDGLPAAMIEVFRVGDQTPTEIADTVHAFVAEQRAELPPGVKLAVWSDRSEILASRMNLLLRNAALGLGLVIVVLGLFLHLRLAFWVTLGIPLSMVGALIFLPAMDVSVNMLSLFAFILVLGIVVDDAIVVGENVYTHRGPGVTPAEASVRGAREVARPVVFSVLTTMAAFAPLLYVSGVMGKFIRNLPTIVIAVLAISLVESLYILPAHLSRSRPPNPRARGPFARFHRWFGARVATFVAGPYTRFLRLALRHRHTTLAIALALVVASVGLFAGHHLKFIFMPELEGDVVRGQLAMPFGTPVAQTEAHVRRLLAAAQKTVAEYDRAMPQGESILRNIYTVVGAQMGRRGRSNTPGAHLGEVAVFLKERDQRNVDSQVFARRWRELAPEIVGAEALEFSATMMSMGAAVDIQLSHERFEVLEAAAERVKEALAAYPGLYDVQDSQDQGKRELKLHLKPAARSLGITERDLAGQVRAAFYGAEALRLQRGRNEVRVMVRYPRSERRSLADVQELRLRTAPGSAGRAGEVPFALAAEVTQGRGYSQISRTDRKRVIHVTARANLKVANPAEILEQLQGGLLAQLLADYPGLSYDLEGQSRHRQESYASMGDGYLVALCVIFALLAIPFRSYAQPLIIMSAIPFGIIGAVAGHLLLGFNVSLMSLAGVVALTGVVVNDSLVLIDFINRNRCRGQDLREAVLEGGRRRFRPIVLTTLTTFFALVPMLAETSVQARFLVPMAVSLAFGVLFATLITLVLIPALYLVLEDVKAAAGRLLGVEVRVPGADAGEDDRPPNETTPQR